MVKSVNNIMDEIEELDAETKECEKIVVRAATKYKIIFSQLIKTGKEGSLMNLLRDEGAGVNNSINVLDYAKENLNLEQRYIIHIHFALAQLEPQEKELIWREYFLNERINSKRSWWTYNYARSTFYRIRTSAVHKFAALCA